MSDFLYNLIHNYKFVVAVATFLALLVELLMPNLQDLISVDFIIAILATLLGVSAGQTYLYDKVQNTRKQ